MKNIALIIPVYNEASYLPTFLITLTSHIKKIPEISHVIFVDDGSTDRTSGILKSYSKSHKNIVIIKNSTNSGKGYAMRKGLYEAARLQLDAVIFMDGDGQHDPSYLPIFIRELKESPVVFGYRKLDEKMPIVRRLGNHIAYFIIHHIFRIHRYGDILCGYLGIRNDVYDRIRFRSDDYGVEAELSAIVGRCKIPFSEVEVSTIYLDTTKGVHMWHALQILLRIPMWNMVHGKE